MEDDELNVEEAVESFNKVRKGRYWPIIMCVILIGCMLVVAYESYKLGGIRACESVGGGLVEGTHECFVPELHSTERLCVPLDTSGEWH
jgi:hypothetical protein|tara:strand:+ start:9521 stop:9787 length:267 start_codon:yes stop_codon:yes gene_type:complete